MVTLLRVVTVLCISCIIHAVQSEGCYPDTGDCDFDDGVAKCGGWDNCGNQCTVETNNAARVLNLNSTFVLVVPGKQSLTSRPVCAFECDSIHHTLSFDCNFLYGEGMELSVLLKTPKKTTIGTITHASGTTEWHHYEFNITQLSTEGENFSVIFEVKGKSNKVFLDNIQYRTSQCPASTVSPSESSSQLSTNVATSLPIVSTLSTLEQTTTPLTSESSTSATTAYLDTLSTSVNGTSEIPSQTANSTSGLITTVPTSRDPNSATAAPSTTSPSNVGTIVGAVIAVIVLLAVIVIVFVVLARRRGKDFWKTWFNKKNKESAQKQNIRMSGLPSAEVLNENDQPLRPNGEIGSMVSAQPSSEDDYSVIQDSDGSFSPSGQSQVNKPQTGVSTANSDLPPSNLAPGFEYNHLEFGKRPATKTGSKPAANQNYSHIKASNTTSADGVYSLGKNPEQQNSATGNNSNYQEALKAAGVYHVLDAEPGNRELDTSTAIYHVPVDNIIPSDEPGVYHEPDDVSKPGGSHNENSIYYNPDDPKYSTQLASAGVYHTLESDPEGQRSSIYHVPDETASKPQAPRKPVGVYEVATNPGDAPKEPTSSPIPNNVYHVLDSETKSVLSPKGVAISNYEIAEPSDVSSSGQASHNSVYHLANASGFSGPQKSNTSSAKTGSNEGDYNSLDFNGKEVVSDADANAVYSHLNEAGEDTYNELNRGRKAEVIDDEYSHLGKQ